VLFSWLRLRQLFDASLPFGGVHVLLFGDMFQLPCPSEMSLVTALVRYTARGYGRSLKLLETSGASLFAQFRRYELTEQKRADPDQIEHIKMIDAMRNTSTSRPFTRAHLANIKPLSLDDVKENPAVWSFSKIVVTSNRERTIFNH
jgi:hypothetical protein